MIHSSAMIHPTAVLGESVEVGPYCVIGPNVKIGDGTRLLSHVVLDSNTTLGAECTIFPFACVGTQTQDLKYRGGNTFVEIGDRTTLREYVTVNLGTSEGEVTKIGSDCHIMAYCHVAHACSVGNGVIMANGTTLAGEVTVEDFAGFGGLTGIHQFVHVGTMCYIGGMTRVSKDCPPFMMIEGVPAEVRGMNTVGMERRGVSADARRRLKQVFSILFRQDLSTRQAVEKIKAETELCPDVERLLKFIAESERGIVK